MFIRFRNENQCMLNLVALSTSKVKKIEPETLELQLPVSLKYFCFFVNKLSGKEGESLTVHCLPQLVDDVTTPSGCTKHVC